MYVCIMVVTAYGTCLLQVRQHLLSWFLLWAVSSNSLLLLLLLLLLLSHGIAPGSGSYPPIPGVVLKIIAPSGRAADNPNLSLQELQVCTTCA